MPSVEWIERTRSWKNHGRKRGLTVTINVYGSSDISPSIASKLSQAGLYLQHPDYCDSDIQYENPHFFKLPHMQNPVSKVFTQDPTVLLPSKEVPSQKVEDVLGILSRHKYLKDIQTDPRITATLLPLVTVDST